MKKLIITYYTIQENGSLILRNNWIEDYSESSLEHYNIPANTSSVDGISNIIESPSELPNVIRHIRVVNISKKSEELKQQSQQEDNDIKSYGLLTKALRESRSERFVEDWLPVLQTKYVITDFGFRYAIETQEHGIIDYFPKANKVLIRKDNHWIKPGLKWIVKNL